MILEKLPELHNLTVEERELLAFELLASLEDAEAVTKVDPAVLRLLEQRRSEFLAAPEHVRPWSEVQARLRARYRVNRSGVASFRGVGP